MTRTTYQIIEAAARQDGVPLAQYMREAALVRVAWERALESGRADADRLLAALEALRHELERTHPPGEQWG
ncbi:MAG TPA: hypothetical protein VGJ32_12420 [Solirubrobacteraceae bacterium]|jgi:hypothetical protein